MVEMVDLELIDDNPYQSRQTYHKQDIDDLAASIKVHGLLQVPLARRKDGRLQLGFGHLRKRAFIKLAKQDQEAYGKMPLDIRDLTDEQMALFALEENLKRHDITPVEVARAVDKYLVSFPNSTETDVAKFLNMTQGNISNMRRVLRLPEQVLEKIDQGRINFTMGRELLIFQALPSEKDLMLEAIRGLRTEGRPYGEPNTVEGLQKCINSVAVSHFPALEKGQGGYRREPLFDTRAAGCLQCQHMIRTHPTKSATAHWCTNTECWEQKQQEHKDRVAAEARAKMTEDVIRKVAEVEVKRRADQDISQEIIEAESPSEGLLTEEEAEAYEEAVVREDEEREEERARIEQVKQLPEDYPCHGCLNVKRCDRRTVYAGEGGKLVCNERVTKETAQVLKESATVEIPEELRPLIEEKAGTRAQVLDLNELWLGDWRRELKQGYALLSPELDRICDPDECLEQCTHGFHYAFDSRRSTGEVLYVCTDPKCLAKKKAAFTRAKHAEGNAKKKAEMAAIRKAVQETTSIDRARMKLIILAQLEGDHVAGYCGAHVSPKRWWQDKLGVEAKDSWDIKTRPIYAALDRLSDEEIARLIVEFMLEMVIYKGDLEKYQVKTTQALNWMGIGVSVKSEL